MAFMTLNLTQPEVIEVVSFAYSHFEVFRINGFYRILDKADICGWVNPQMGEISGLTVSLWQISNATHVSYTRHPLPNLTCDMADRSIAL